MSLGLKSERHILGIRDDGEFGFHLRQDVSQQRANHHVGKMGRSSGVSSFLMLLGGVLALSINSLQRLKNHYVWNYIALLPLHLVGTVKEVLRLYLHWPDEFF